MNEEKVLFGHLRVYRERGAFLRRLEQFDKAKDAYTEAYRITQDNVRLLNGLSQVCADSMNQAKAYEVAELALKLQPHNMIARNMQANALYTMSDFERSVVMNYRGSRYRQQPPYFREGMNQGVETIQDCVGVNSGNVMLDFLPLIKQNEAARAAAANLVPPKHISRIPQLIKRKKLTQLEAREHMILGRVLAMKYLGPIAYDKFFVQDLTRDLCIQSANAPGSQQLKKLIDETLGVLTERQETLRAQRPYYTIKLAEKAESEHQNIYKRQLLFKERHIGAYNSEQMLKSIDKCVRTYDIKGVITKAERMQAFLDSKTPRTLPDKEMYTDRLYRSVGEGYLSQYRLSYTLSERSNRRRIAFLMGLPIGRPSSFDSVMAKYPYRFVDLDQAEKKIKASLDMCENSTMKCWLMYELSKMLCTQKNYALAKYYGKRCQKEAQEIQSATWWLNGCFALMSGDMQQNNANEIRIHVEEAREWTNKLQEPVAIQAFLTKCYEMASEAVSADERKLISQREQEILRAIDSALKVETEVLFKRISTVPMGRRFTVLPRGKDSASRAAVERQRYRQRGLTIVPGMEKGIRPLPKSKVLGFQIFDTY